MKKPTIRREVENFLEAHRKFTATSLARMAGIHPTILTKVLSGKRKDMLSGNADELRIAMREIDLGTPTPISTAETPSERKEASCNE